MKEITEVGDIGIGDLGIVLPAVYEHHRHHAILGPRELGDMVHHRLLAGAVEQVAALGELQEGKVIIRMVNKEALVTARTRARKIFPPSFVRRASEDRHPHQE